MFAGQWTNGRTGSLLLLASLVAVLAFLFGNAYASHGHAEEGGHAEEDAAEGEEHAEEAEGETGSRSLKIGESIVISAAGVGLVPFGLLLFRRRPRDEDELPPAPETPVPTAPPGTAARYDLEAILRPALALLSAGAAVIHFVVIPGHWDEYWGQGLFFLVGAIAQLLWAVWVVVAPSRLIYLAGAAGNAAIVAMWVVTRTAGIPVGPGAGEREAVEFADTLATAFEVVLVIGALVLARTAARRTFQTSGALATSALLAVVVAALTAASLLSLVEL
jgi:hypothetical protein